MSQPKDDLYFVRAGGYVKIGRTRNLRARLVSIQTGCPHPISAVHYLKGQGDREREMHSRLAGHRANGEWFHWNRIVANVIRDQNPTDKRRMVKPAKVDARLREQA